MHFPALHFSCILGALSLVHAIPVHQDILIKNLVKLQADTIVLRIKDHNEKLKLSPKLLIGDPDLYPEVPADKPIQGLGSIVDTVTTFQKVLQKLPKGHVSQIRNDLSTLLGYLKDRMTSMRCTLKEPANERSLDAFLEDNATHHVTFGYLALDRLKRFMQKLTVNLDHLKSC
ncbi:leptin a isoform X2 [Puntigrus tetrazona]|uniref:leptin a isoform X2 n=1 Tax=Puntigrus tetrazona TaxID=1606681 RepID=UPI001C89B36B|nr:leptin a isoform X2 [Puntigrus tetrazona]